MPPQTQSIKVLRDQAPPSKINRRELEMAKYFEKFHALVSWLRDNWDGQTIVVPLPPNMLNGGFSRAHWMEKSALKNQYAGFLEALRSARMMPEPPSSPPAKVLLEVHLFVRSEMDDEGAMARCKWPIDLFCRAGYMTDDDRAHMTRGMPQQTVTQKEPQRIEFQITEIAEV